MKWLIIFFSVIKPLLSSGMHESPSAITEIKEMIKANAVKVMLTFAALSALSMIFAAGVMMIAIDMGAQIDQTSNVYFSAMIIIGIVLMLVPLLIGALAVRRFDLNSSKTHRKQALTAVGYNHPLQDALALLIQDFIKEREVAREQKGVMKKEEATFHEKAADSHTPRPDDFRH